MAYALISLVQIIEQDQHHLLLDSSCKSQVQSLLKKARVLKDLAEESYTKKRNTGEMKKLETRIREAAQKAEDIIESYVMDPSLPFDLAEVMQEFERIKLMLYPKSRVKTHVVEECELIHHHRMPYTNPKSTIKKGVMGEFARIKHPILMLYSNLKSAVREIRLSKPQVYEYDYSFLDGEFATNSLANKLTERTKSRLQLIHIEGTGKKSVVQEVYNDFSIATHFKRRTWAVITQQNNMRHILLALLGSLSYLTDIMHQQSNDILGGYLRKSLAHKRYLIVVHISETEASNKVNDILESGVWGDMQRFFPDEQNGSTIIILRSMIESNHAKSSMVRTYWDVLHFLVFEKGSCPPELEVLGENIAETCIRFRLNSFWISGLLSTSKHARFWELVASKISSISSTDDPHSSTLSVIYDLLPSHLKPCFLYIAAFPDKANIQSSRIIKMWIAEEFVEPSDCTFEEEAELYLEDLIHMKLLLPSRKDLDGKVKAFKVANNVISFCRKKASEENFLWFKVSREHSILEDNERRVSLHPLSEPVNKMTSMSLARSFLCFGPVSTRLIPYFENMRLLRVLDVFQLEFNQFPKEILQLVLLKYLALSCRSDLPSAISIFLNLRTLIIRRLSSSRAFTIPPGLWELAQLRHVISKETCVWYFPSNGMNVYQWNLQTLSNIHVFLLTYQFIERIPNVKKLGIFCDSSVNTAISLDCLQKLETLKCSASWSSVARNFLSYLKFPASLKKLTLSFCQIPLEFMATVGSLPNLEQLKLQYNDFLDMGLDPVASKSEQIEPEWVSAEGQFTRLRSLIMKELNLVHWRAHANHFPRLELLVIRDCYSMKEIPLAILDIETLKLIDVDKTSPSVLASAQTALQMKVARPGHDFPELRIANLESAQEIV